MFLQALLFLTVLVFRMFMSMNDSSAFLEPLAFLEFFLCHNEYTAAGPHFRVDLQQASDHRA